jgi:RHS repeat-associated protein
MNADWADGRGFCKPRIDPEYIDLAFAFTGRLLDKNTGLQNNLNRWYDASTGKWLSEDPIGFAAGDGNLYRYVGNGPVNGTDPSGLDPAFAPSIGIGSGFYRKDPVLPIDGAIQEPQYIWVCLGAYGAVGGITFGVGSLIGGGAATGTGAACCALDQIAAAQAEIAELEGFLASLEAHYANAIASGEAAQAASLARTISGMMKRLATLQNYISHCKGW